MLGLDTHPGGRIPLSLVVIERPRWVEVGGLRDVFGLLKDATVTQSEYDDLKRVLQVRQCAPISNRCLLLAREGHWILLTNTHE